MALSNRSNCFCMASMTASCFHRLTRFTFSLVQRGRRAQSAAVAGGQAIVVNVAMMIGRVHALVKCSPAGQV